MGINFGEFTAALPRLMDADKKAQIQTYAQAIAALLYEETDPEPMKTDHKAVNLQAQGVGAFFQENGSLVNWVMF